MCFHDNLLGTDTLVRCVRNIYQAGRGLCTVRKYKVRWVGTAYLHEAHSNSAHFGEFIHCLETMVHRLCQQLSKLLVVENFQATPTGDLADSRGMKTMMVVAVPTLHEDAAVAEAFGIHLSANVVQVDPCDRTRRVSRGNVALHTGILTHTHTLGELCYPCVSQCVHEITMSLKNNKA